MGECVQEHQGQAGSRVGPQYHLPNIPSLQEVKRWSGSFCWSPTYSGELARVPRVHLQEDHSLRRLLTNLARPHSAGDQVQALSVKSLVISIFLHACQKSYFRMNVHPDCQEKVNKIIRAVQTSPALDKRFFVHIFTFHMRQTQKLAEKKFAFLFCTHSLADVINHALAPGGEMPTEVEVAAAPEICVRV